MLRWLKCVSARYRYRNKHIYQCQCYHCIALRKRAGWPSYEQNIINNILTFKSRRGEKKKKKRWSIREGRRKIHLSKGVPGEDLPLSMSAVHTSSHRAKHTIHTEACSHTSRSLALHTINTMTQYKQFTWQILHPQTRTVNMFAKNNFM